MGWLTELSTVYDRILENKKIGKKPLPLYHIANNAPLEITLDGEGEFVSAKLLEESEKADWQTCMPCTEESAARAPNVEAYPFCDKLEYVAGDYEKYCKGKELQAKHAAFVDTLEKWAQSEYSNQKIKSVYAYVQKGCLIKDILEGSNIPKLKSPNDISALKGFVRWNVIIPGDVHSQTWQDPEIHQLWIDYYSKNCLNPKAFCYVTGKTEQIAKFHSKKIRHSGDAAKLISSNDKSNYTFRGRFSDAGEACQISMEVSVKAHNALRWLIERQGTVVGNELTVVAWCTAPDIKPQLLKSSRASLLEEEDDDDEPREYFAAEESAKAIKNRLLGYYGKLKNSDKILVMTLNAATPGRMSLLLYREFNKSDFCEAQEYWHYHLAWFCRYWDKDKKEWHHIGFSPSPKEIAEAAYGERINDSAMAMTIQRLLSCILDKTPIPADIEQLCFSRASRLNTLEKPERTLETACAVIKYNLFAQKEEDYKVGLDENQRDRDYLYGRLLAVADKIETVVLDAREENRQSNAVRYMQRFARYPYSTWNYIYTDKLQPYLKYLKQMQPGLYGWYEGIMQDISDKFVYDEFISDKSLSGKFLLGYHCQQKDFWRKREKNQPANEKDGN